MHAEGDVLKWLKHRWGEQALDETWPRCERKALQLNDDFPDLLKTFGERDFRGFVGFVDAVGSSQFVSGCAPTQVAQLMTPFLQTIVTLVKARGAYVDKTIGDEAMFILPDTSEEGGPPAALEMGQLLGGLYDLQAGSQWQHPFRIGLAFGKLCLAKVEGAGYSECTTYGESVIMAKRLTGLPEIDPTKGVYGAFGVLEYERDFAREFQTILNVVAGSASRMAHRILDDPPDLKGIGHARVALFVEKG